MAGAGLMQIDEMVQKLLAAASDGAERLQATAKEAIEQLRREAEAFGEISAGGLNERAAAVWVSDLKLLGGRSDSDAVNVCMNCDVFATGMPASISLNPRQHTADLKPGDYRIITFILPLKR